MKSFDCQVVDSQGRKQSLRRSGPGEDWILRDLNAEGFYILSIREAGDAPRSGGERLRLKDVIEFTQTLGTLMANGLTLKETLKVASDVFPNSRQQTLFRRIDAEVSKGQSLHRSLEPWASSLPPLYLGLIKIGEKTGDLSGILNQLAEYLQTRKALQDKTGNALAYPAFVLGIAAVGLVLLMTLVFPTLTSIISSLNAKAAAAYAENLAGFQNLAVGTGAAVVLLAAALAVTVWRRRSDPGFRVSTDRWLLRIPVVGPYLFATFGLNFCFSVETLLAAGYSLEETLEESSGVVTNRYLRGQIAVIRDAVLKGKRLSQAFVETRAFPRSLTGWIAVGEGAHDLGRIFTQLRRYYQQDLDKFHNRFLNLVEPAMILLVGGLLVFLVLTFITPVFTMLGNLL